MVLHWNKRLATLEANKTRLVWYVDGTNGNDANSGRLPTDAFATIGAAVTAASAGDRIIIAEDTYSEAVSIPAGLVGLEVICEPGVVISTAATVVTIAAPDVKWIGGRISQAGQIGLAISGANFYGQDIVSTLGTVAFDIDGAGIRLLGCLALAYTTIGFDTAVANGQYIQCFAIGTAAVTGFNLSNTAAETNIFLDCHSLNNTANGWNLIAGADNNLIIKCSQSSLCGGPADAGANNSWVEWAIESQITAGNSVQADIDAIYTRIGAPAGASIAADLVVIDDFVDTLEAAVGAIEGATTLHNKLTAARAALLDEITAVRLTELDAANIPADTDPTVMGRAQIAATTIDLNQAAATYDLFTGTTQVVILESLNFKCPTGAAGGALTSISIQTDDATAGVIISAAAGAVGNLTSEADLSWTGSLYITVATKIRLTIAGGAHGAGYVCNVTAKFRAVVSGGYLG